MVRGAPLARQKVGVGEADASTGALARMGCTITLGLLYPPNQLAGPTLPLPSSCLQHDSKKCYVAAAGEL